MTYDSDAQVGGRIASVGQRLVDSSAKAIIKQSLDGLNATMKARLAEESGDEAKPPKKPAPPPRPRPKRSSPPPSPKKSPKT